jgi:hypothetical protein
MTAKLRDIAAKLRRRMNDPVEQTGNWLNQVVRGYFNYHAVPGNLKRLYAEAAQSAQPVDVGSASSL